MGQVCFPKNIFEHFESICLNIQSAYEHIFTKGRLRGDKSPYRTLHFFVLASRVLFSSRCPTFRVSLLSSLIHGILTWKSFSKTLIKTQRFHCSKQFVKGVVHQPRVSE